MRQNALRALCNMRAETFAASLPGQGRSQNEDAFLMGRVERLTTYLRRSGNHWK
jgi:hypothetical protein